MLELFNASSGAGSPEPDRAVRTVRPDQMGSVMAVTGVTDVGIHRMRVSGGEKEKQQHISAI